jgi:hypothetical protein
MERLLWMGGMYLGLLSLVVLRAFAGNLPLADLLIGHSLFFMVFPAFAGQA